MMKKAETRNGGGNTDKGKKCEGKHDENETERRGEYGRGGIRIREEVEEEEQ